MNKDCPLAYWMVHTPSFEHMVFWVENDMG